MYTTKTKTRHLGFKKGGQEKIFFWINFFFFSKTVRFMAAVVVMQFSNPLFMSIGTWKGWVTGNKQRFQAQPSENNECIDISPVTTSLTGWVR